MKYLLKLIGLILVALMPTASIYSADNTPLQTITIPNSEYLQGLEYSCMKHIQAKKIFRALEILNVMNWQCLEKNGFNTEILNANETGKINEYLEEAKNAKNDFLKAHKGEWVCNPKPILNQVKREFYFTIAKRTFEYLISKSVNSEVANVVIAQMAQETAWGTKVLGNNYFNIKGSYRGESVQFTTSEEYTDGKWTRIVDNFRKYPSMETAIDDYIRVLSEKWPMAYQSMFSKNNPGVAGSFIASLRAGLKGGYATDKNYAGKLRSLGDQVKFEMNGGVLPTYLKCLGREAEIKQ